jgi:hypothetical protein
MMLVLNYTAVLFMSGKYYVSSVRRAWSGSTAGLLAYVFGCALIIYFLCANNHGLFL